MVVLYFSGHGYVPPDQEMFYFEPIDIHGESNEDQSKGAISTAMLVDMVRNIKAKHIILIIDACQSGGASDSLRQIAEARVASDRVEYGTETPMLGCTFSLRQRLSKRH